MLCCSLCMSPVTPEQVRCDVEGAGRGSFRPVWIVLELAGGSYRSPHFPLLLAREWLRTHFRTAVDERGERVYRRLSVGEPGVEIRERRKNLVLVPRGAGPGATLSWRLNGSEIGTEGREIAPPRPVHPRAGDEGTGANRDRACGPI